MSQSAINNQLCGVCKAIDHCADEVERVLRVALKDDLAGVLPGSASFCNDIYWHNVFQGVICVRLHLS